MSNFIAMFIALAFFTVIAALSTFVAAVSMNVIYGLLGLITIAIVYSGTGGRVWFAMRERPERIIGAKIITSATDGLNGNTEQLPVAVVRAFEGRAYRAYFLKPVRIETKLEHYVDLYARYAGYPISSTGKWHGRFVAGKLESGCGFIGIIHRT